MVILAEALVAATTRGYLPISAYGAIGDCRTAALVAPDGAIDWCCLPHFDSPAILCRLLDSGRGGFFQVRPRGAPSGEMRYFGNTNILQTNFLTAEGRVQLTDFMPIRERQRGMHTLHDLVAQIVPRLPLPMRRGIERDTGNDVAAAHRLQRLAKVTSGQATIEVILKPTFDFARQTAQIERLTGNDRYGGALLSAGGRFLVFVVQASEAITWEIGDDIIGAQIAITAGQQVVASLNYARDRAEALALGARLMHHDAERDLHETRTYWEQWAARCHYDGFYRGTVLRSALALKLCTFEPTGAIVAAPTTSLPEAIGGVRNWDYRYSWLRDASLTLDALGALGYSGEARDYFHFLNDLHVKSGGDLRVLYGLYGEDGDALTEQELPNLEGYRGSRPVRVGNGAAEQHQLDIYGELIDAAHSYFKHGGFGLPTLWPQRNRSLRSLVATIADYVADHWQELDRGIWEVRGQPQAFVYSRVMCWVALDRACRMASIHGHQKHVGKWNAVRQTLHAEIMARGYDPQLASFTQAYNLPVIDAANLRIPFVGFLGFDDPHVVSTVDVTTRTLAGPHGLVHRYRPAGAPDGPTEAGLADDGLPGTEGAFLACSFWLIRALAHQGRHDEAWRRFDQLVAYASPLGLFAEEIDPTTDELLGNYPQAFSHIGLIDAAIALSAESR